MRIQLNTSQYFSIIVYAKGINLNMNKIITNISCIFFKDFKKLKKNIFSINVLN